MFQWRRPVHLCSGDDSPLRSEGVGLIVGLGNPGKTYEQTRHNVGFLVIERFAARHGLGVQRHFRKALTGDWKAPKGRILLARPQTFMNASGDSVAAIAGFYHLMPEQVLVVCDDVSLPFGRLRIRRSGSEGGHNGLRSISHRMGTRDYPRLRVGIGKPPESWDMIDYVLSAFTSSERQDLPDILDLCCDALELCADAGIEVAMNRFNAAASQ